MQRVATLYCSLGWPRGYRMDYQDPKIAAIYEVVNPIAQDLEFYLSLAGRQSLSVLDLGCGTGTLCCALAERGHQVIGVEPSAAMLAVARSKPFAERVEWVESSAQTYRSQRCFDLIVMTGHAFQVFLTDADALAALETMRRHLTEHGTIAFESRNPQMDWVSKWNAKSRILWGGQISETMTITDVAEEFISFQTLYQTPDEILTTLSTLRFPSRKQIEALIVCSGLAVREIFGDWNASPFEPTRSPEMIFVLKAAKYPRSHLHLQDFLVNECNGDSQLKRRPRHNPRAIPLFREPHDSHT